MMRAALLLAILIAIGPLAGCLSGSPTGSDPQKIQKLQGKGAGSGTSVYPGTYKFDGAFSQVLAPGPFAALPGVRAYIKSQIDGVDIEMGIFRPDVPEGTKVPVIVDASPYYRTGSNVITLRGHLLFLHDNFVPYGYAVAAVSVRGTGDSGGCMDLMGAKEVKDLDTAITWLGEQPWSNGNVGMIGLSYDGSTPWDVASTGNVHLKTIVPISGLPDIYGLMYRNGSSEQRGAFLVNALYYTYGPAPDDATNTADQQRSPGHRAEGSACVDYGTGLFGAGWATAAGSRDPTGYWQERNRKPAIEKNYRGSILHVQGLNDWNVDPALTIPWTSKLNQSGLEVKWMLGQWPHAYPDSGVRSKPPAPYSRFDWAEILLHWFDKYLKEMPNVDTGPAVQVQDDLYQWRNEEFFPPRDAHWTTYYLATGNKLAAEPGPAGSILLYPNPAAEALGPNLRAVPGYSADFGLVAPGGGLRISGLPRIHVTVTPQGPTGHLSAWLYDVDEKGVEKRIAWTTMNLLYADGTETMKPITPQQPLVAKMEFQPMDAFVPAGHRLIARIWEYQDADRLPAIPPEPVAINFGGSVKSVVELPIIERPPEAFFNPPMPS